MQLVFDPNLCFQNEAVNSVCDLFQGQDIHRGRVATLDSNFLSNLGTDSLRHGNVMTLTDTQILKNLNEVQRKQGLAISSTLNSRDFSVEMETGTGKTYVYTRTIFELNKRYGFTKFIIIVPSVAIREGVFKSLSVTESHFRNLYSGTPCKFYLYDSAKLNFVCDFATSPHISIMVMTVASINKQAHNNVYKIYEQTLGESPMKLIQSVNPILIVDEPQSVDGGSKGKGKQALEEMNPLCTLRYSATHRELHHLVYYLGPVEAFEQNLVKQIEVASASTRHSQNKPYIRLVSTTSTRTSVSATLELDVSEQRSGKVSRCKKKVLGGSDLGEVTGREIYQGLRIGEIRCERENQFIEVTHLDGKQRISKGEILGDADIDILHRELIKRTIREHLDRELQLTPKGIKVLSIFFIDAVKRYRTYDQNGNPIPGKLVQIFEKEYSLFTKDSKYTMLFNREVESSELKLVHEGYFSIDKHRRWTDTSESNREGRENAARAYQLIMRDKERLLSLKEPLKFIFSHSALREGWDNPNVFQICVLGHMQSEFKRRQTIGRGLRLCVNQKGQRVDEVGINRLTVVAREQVEEFAKNLQQEIEQESSVKFGKLTPSIFAKLELSNETLFGDERSQALFKYLSLQGCIDSEGRVTTLFRDKILDGEDLLPQELIEHKSILLPHLHKLAFKVPVKNADERYTVRPRKSVLRDNRFKALWDQIKHKTTFHVKIDPLELQKKCIQSLRERLPSLPSAVLTWNKSNVEISREGVGVVNTETSGVIPLDEENILVPNLLYEIQRRTLLTRRSLHRILIKSGSLKHFKRKPQQCIELASEVINRCKRDFLVNGVKYKLIGEEVFYAQELLDNEEQAVYLKKLVDRERSSKSVFDHVIYDSNTEKEFADQLEKNTSVKLYSKLPRWFVISTPLGQYNPDWAILIVQEDGEWLYFVAETKGSTDDGNLRGIEKDKIQCAKAHFEALATNDGKATFKVVNSLDDLI